MVIWQPLLSSSSGPIFSRNNTTTAEHEAAMSKDDAEVDEMATMLGEIESLAAADDRDILAVIEKAQALLHASDATLASLDNGDDVHQTLAGHFDALSDVAALIAAMEASAPTMDAAAAQLDAVEAALKDDDQHINK